MMRTEGFRTVYVGGVCVVVTLAVLLLTGCSNAQIRRTPVSAKSTPWFCEMNEARDDWQCVQDAALAANPRPERLPGDPGPEQPARQQAQVARADGELSSAGAGDTAAGLSPLANPSAAIDPGALEAVPVVLDDGSALLAMSEDGYAVQLIATATRPLAESFVAAHGLSDAITLQLAREAEYYYVVLLGTYGSFGEAQAAVDDRPESLADITPWIRPLLSIQSGILAARELDTEPGS